MGQIAKRASAALLVIAALFAFASILGAQEALADGDRAAVTEFVAESDAATPTYGAAVTEPTITVVTGSPAVFSDVSWLKKSGDEWQPFEEATFSAGTYRLGATIEIDDGGDEYVIGWPVSVTVDDEEWTTDWDEPEITSTSSRLEVASPEFTVAHPSGWSKEGDDWYYYDANGSMVTSKWVKDSKGWCYLQDDGKMLTNGFAADSKGECYVGSDGYMITSTKWVKVDDVWYHVTKGYMDKSDWYKDSKGWCYVGDDGKMLTNDWAQDSKGWCYLGEDGYWVADMWVEKDGEMRYVNSDHYMATEEWAEDEGGWRWMDSEGKIAKSQWIEVDGDQYYVDDEGYRVTGLVEIDGETRHFDDNGKYTPNYWEKDENGWKWMCEDGTFAAGEWVKDGNSWYYIKDDGYMAADEWVKYKDKWYYLKSSGRMAAGEWVSYNGTWYYLKSSGVMAAKEWVKDTNGWRYMDASGKITKSQWVKDGGYWYYLKPNGYMAIGSLVIDGKLYYFDSNGKWVDKPTKDTYRIYVNRKQNVITIYSRDASGKYNIPVRSFICSTGEYNATPTGWYQISDKYRWHQLNGGVYGQYCSRYRPSMLFHSVYYYEGGNKASISTRRYNGLGTQTSQGCINMTVIDAKWIYENCPSGTWVYIFDSDSNGPLGKPAAQHLTTNSNWSWCPTDPDPNNPYQKGLKSLTITNADGQTVSVGGTLKLNVKIETSGTVGQFAKCVKWISSDYTVATVDANGNVKGLKAGTATITVYNLPETKSDTYKVRVVP